jgi:hypothetical protein
VLKADNITCRLSLNLEASNSWKYQGLSRPVMGLLDLALLFFYTLVAKIVLVLKLVLKLNYTVIIKLPTFISYILSMLVIKYFLYSPCNKFNTLHKL